MEIGKKREKAKSRIWTAEFNLWKPVPYSIGHGFLGFLYFYLEKFEFLSLKAFPRTKLNLFTPSATSNGLFLFQNFPEFLCQYHFSFCGVIPPTCIQMRNLIFSAFSHNMRFSKPFTSNLKVFLYAINCSMTLCLLLNHMCYFKGCDITRYFKCSTDPSNLHPVYTTHSQESICIIDKLLLYIIIHTAYCII